MKLKLNNHQIKDIVFDFGGVLLDIDINLTLEAFRKLDITGVKGADIHPMNSGLFLDLELGLISTAEFVDGIRKCSKDADLSDQQILEAWNALLLDYDIRRFELLEKLRENYGVYLLSNTNLPHRENFIAKFESETGRNLEAYFDKVFYSDVMHMRKPDVEIYQSLLDQTGLDPRTTLFIDDNAHNLVGANEVGIHTYHLAKPETVLDLFE